jgi:hypothetical protein
VGDEDPVRAPQRFDIAVAHAEAVGQPEAMRDHLSGKTMVCVARRHGWKEYAVLSLRLPDG